MKTGAAAGQKLMITGVANDLVMIGFNDRQIPTWRRCALVTKSTSTTQSILRGKPSSPPDAGARILCVEAVSESGWEPKYAQRPLLPGYRTRKFSTASRVVAFLQDDRDGMPDGRGRLSLAGRLVSNKVREHLGAKIDDSYRLWYVDHAMHVSPGSYLAVSEGGNINRGYSAVDTHIVSYAGVLQQALRDLAAWAERGLAPPQSTTYTFDDGQVIVPPRRPTQRPTAHGRSHCKR